MIQIKIVLFKSLISAVQVSGAGPKTEVEKYYFQKLWACYIAVGD